MVVDGRQPPASAVGVGTYCGSSTGAGRASKPGAGRASKPGAGRASELGTGRVSKLGMGRASNAGDALTAGAPPKTGAAGVADAADGVAPAAADAPAAAAMRAAKSSGPLIEVAAVAPVALVALARGADGIGVVVRPRTGPPADVADFAALRSARVGFGLRAARALRRWRPSFAEGSSSSARPANRSSNPLPAAPREPETPKAESRST